MENDVHLKRTLSLWSVIFFGLSFMAPITIFGIYGVAVTTSGGMVATGYILTIIVILFSAFSYARFAKEFPQSGSSYTYINKSLGANLGFLVGWTLLLDYLLSPMISSLLFALLVKMYLPAVPFAISVIGFLTIIVIVNILGIKIATTVNSFVVIFQLAFIFLFCCVSGYGLTQGKGQGELLTIAPFFDSNVSFIALLTIVPILYFCFLGFDATTTLAEETVNPGKVIPKAIFGVVLVGFVLFLFTSYFMYAIFPNIEAFNNPDVAAAEIVQYVGGNLLSSFYLAVSFTAGLASAISSCGSASRIMYSMGREGIIPNKFFGYLSPRFQTPLFNILLVGVIGCSSLFLSLTVATHLISFGVLFGFGFINFAAFYYFYIVKKQQSGKYIIFNLIIPLVGSLITFAFLFTLGKVALILGGSWMILGFFYLVIKTRGFKRQAVELADNF